jgi:hypothetical protein
MYSYLDFSPADRTFQSAVQKTAISSPTAIVPCLVSSLVVATVLARMLALLEPSLLATSRPTDVRHDLKEMAHSRSPIDLT